LPLYGWQEDIDFSRQFLRRGRLVRSGEIVGVHRGVKEGRTSGVRFGYSQVINPIYLRRKGTMRWQHAYELVWRNVTANLLMALRPEPWIDRRGRVKGNALAFWDVARGVVDPERMLQVR
jgi:hypothetical protein